MGEYTGEIILGASILIILFIYILMKISKTYQEYKFNNGNCKKCGKRLILISAYSPKNYKYQCAECKTVISISDKTSNRIFEEETQRIKRQDEEMRIKAQKEEEKKQKALMKGGTFFVTAFEKIPDRRTNNGGKQRTCGSFPSSELAMQSLIQYPLDVQDGTYKYVIVENVPYGLFPEATSRIWLKFSVDRWVLMEEPKKSVTSASLTIL